MQDSDCSDHDAETVAAASPTDGCSGGGSGGDDDRAEESLAARLERLGRERPPVFAGAWSEAAFVLSVIMSQFLTEYFVSGFTLILPTLMRELGVAPAAVVWPSTAFSLAIASTLLIFGRLGDMWGGRAVYVWGLGWLLLWSVIAGFSVSPVMLNVCRALQGLGAAAALPAGVMLMGSAYRPGPRKNLVFSIYGTAAVLGFFGGILLAGVVGQFLRWGFYFWIGAIFALVSLLASIYSIPGTITTKDSSAAAAAAAKVTMDYYGAASIVAGLILTIFAVIQSAHAPEGWRTPYVPVCFTLGVLLLLLAFYVEGYVAEHPLLPASILKVPSMAPLLVALILLYGCWGIFSVFGTLFFQNVLVVSPLQIAVWYVPLGLGGLLIGLLEALILHLVSGRVLLVVSGLGAVGSQLLIALMPTEGWSYWAWVFPATILSTIGIDLSTILMNVFITTKLPLRQQGLAGGILNSALQLGVALTLAWTELLQSRTVGDGDRAGLAASYKNTFWFGVGSATLGLLLVAVWGRVPKAASELTADERAALMREER